MLREFSAGAVVLRYMQDEWWVAVIEPGSSGEPEDRKNLVALPKGNIEPGEKAAQAAEREVWEETGVRAKILSKLSDIKYVYVRKWSDGERIFKVVSFYLMKYESGRIGDITEAMQREVRAAYWMRLTEAAKKLSYSGEKQMARAALTHMEAHPEEFAKHVATE